MSRNTGESPIRRAAGLILWRQEHQKPHGGGPYTWPEIIAEVTHKEPELTEAQIRFAIGWANAARQFRDLAHGEDKTLTLAQLREQSGIAHFTNRDNWPDDE